MQTRLGDLRRGVGGIVLLQLLQGPRHLGHLGEIPQSGVVGPFTLCEAPEVFCFVWRDSAALVGDAEDDVLGSVAD